jgi:hypothetical protein
MNKLFKKAGKEVIILDENYALSHDGFKGVVLTFSEEREREKETKIEGKKVKTGEVEKYIYTEPRYFAKVDQALERYIELSQTTPTKTIEEILEVCKNINKTLEEFKKYKNW